MALAILQKGSSSVGEYFTKTKMLADEMAFVGKALNDEEVASYILTELEAEYNPVVSAVAARTKPISLNELYSEVLAFENRIDLLLGSQQMSANAASGGRSFERGDRDHGTHGGHGRGGNPRPAGMAATTKEIWATITTPTSTQSANCVARMATLSSSAGRGSTHLSPEKNEMPLLL